MVPLIESQYAVRMPVVGAHRMLTRRLSPARLCALRVQSASLRHSHREDLQAHFLVFHYFVNHERLPHDGHIRAVVPGRELSMESPLPVIARDLGCWLVRVLRPPRKGVSVCCHGSDPE